MSIDTAERLQSVIEELIDMRDKAIIAYKKANKQRRPNIFKRIDRYNLDIANFKVERNVAIKQAILETYKGE